MENSSILKYCEWSTQRLLIWLPLYASRDKGMQFDCAFVKQSYIPLFLSFLSIYSFSENAINSTNLLGLIQWTKSE